MCAWAMRIAGINRLVLALRYAALNRTDLGRYNVEAFAQMMDWPLELTQGVREAEYLALRGPWEQNRAKK